MDQMLTGLMAYDPSEVTLLLGGWSPYGFAEGTKITVTKTGDIITPYSGTDGDVSLALQRNTLGTLTMSLQATSSANEVMTAFHSQMYLTRTVAFPVWLEDPRGFIVNTIGWIQSQGENTIGNEVTAVDWVIGLKNCTLTKGTTAISLNAIQGITV